MNEIRPFAKDAAREEWIALLDKARSMGITIAEIRQFFQQKKAQAGLTPTHQNDKLNVHTP